MLEISPSNSGLDGSFSKNGEESEACVEESERVRD
jgi:hypothetical protein